MAGATGLEPAASAVTGQRSNQLSYAPAGDGSGYRRPYPKSRQSHPADRNCEKALFTAKNRWSDRPRIVYRGMVFGASPSSRIHEEGPTDGYSSWKSPTTRNS